MANPKKRSKFEPPEPTTGDTAHLAAGALLSLVPGAAELFEYFVTPPLEKRRQEWMREIGEALRELERNKGVSLEQLQSNDKFVDALLHASQLIARNSQIEKRNALKNAVLNAALLQAPEESLLQMFLEWIDIFTVWHLKILSFMDNPDQWIKLSSNQPGKVDMDDLKKQWLDEGGNQYTGPMNRGSFIFFIEAVYPELKERKSFYPQIVRDLYVHGLISVEDLSSIEWDGILTKRSTELGVQFLGFIRNPY